MLAIILEGYTDIPSDRFDAVARVIPQHVQEMVARLGCISFDIVPSPDIPHRFLAKGTFRDQVAVDAHFKPSKVSDWAKLTAGLPRIYMVSRTD